MVSNRSIGYTVMSELLLLTSQRKFTLVFLCWSQCLIVMKMLDNTLVYIFIHIDIQQAELSHGRISLTLVLLVLVVNFVSEFRLELVYISLIVYVRSSLTYLHGFHSLHKSLFFFFCNNSKSESKVMFRQASNLCKWVLEAAKLAYVNKAKESITSQKLVYWDFW